MQHGKSSVGPVGGEADALVGWKDRCGKRIVVDVFLLEPREGCFEFPRWQVPNPSQLIIEHSSPIDEPEDPFDVATTGLRDRFYFFLGFLLAEHSKDLFP